MPECTLEHGTFYLALRHATVGMLRYLMPNNSKYLPYRVGTYIPLELNTKGHKPRL